MTQEMCTGCACMAMAAIGEATRERDAAIARAEAAEALAASRLDLTRADVEGFMQALHDASVERIVSFTPQEASVYRRLYMFGAYEDEAGVRLGGYPFTDEDDAALRAHAAKVSR